MPRDITEEMKKDDRYIWYMNVFFVEGDLDEEKPKELYKRHRCWGWYRDFAKAEQAIKENWTDMYEEGYYNLAMIESSEEGICYLPHTQWYRVAPVLNENYGKVVPVQAGKEKDGVRTVAFGTGGSEGPMHRSEGWRIKGYDVTLLDKQPRRFKHYAGFSLG